ncbi:MAG: Gfo/Idh/MocA family oxidoreductase [Planctomycetaceae bacterium]|jgi:predicted dehydrogenase|nr:Gfo/Idh/MocA family oxidoreductase [Planctomycetaceae bacterium]
MYPTVSRRSFVKKTLQATALTVAVPALIPRSVLAQGKNVGANDRIIVGFTGTGGRARQLMGHVPQERAKIVAVADLWTQKMVDCINQKKKEGTIPNVADWKMYHSDLEMYEKEKLDAAFVITQDHCRTLAGIRALQAGLDVYAEKALTTYIAEGRVLVNWVRKTKRIFQVGSQQRSMKLNRFGCELVRTGKLGKLKFAQGINYPGPKLIPDDLPEQPVPEGLNWDAWQGPTKYRPFNGQLLGWMQWRDYAAGEMTNWGAHGVDQIQWAVGGDGTGPIELEPLTPDEPNFAKRKIVARYANGAEVRFDLDNGPWGGGIFRCEKGNIEINRNLLKANPESLIDGAPEADLPEGPTWIARPHIENFLDCIASRKLPNGDVEIGHRSITVCHLIGICREVNRKIKWDPVKEQIIGDDEANSKVDRPRRKGYELPPV